MSYTRPWNEVTPAEGTSLAVDLNDEIRALKVDLRERMGTLPGVVWTSDPVWSAPPMHWSQGTPGSSAIAWNQGNGYVTPAVISTVLPWLFNIVPSSVIRMMTKVSVYCSRSSAGAAVTCTVYRQNLQNGAVTSIGSGVMATSTGYGVFDIIMSETFLTDHVYWAEVIATADGSNPSSARIHGLKVTYA